MAATHTRGRVAIAPESDRYRAARAKCPTTSDQRTRTIPSAPLDTIARLQRTAGNQAVNQLLRQYAGQRSSALPRSTGAPRALARRLPLAGSGRTPLVMAVAPAPQGDDLAPALAREPRFTLDAAVGRRFQPHVQRCGATPCDCGAEERVAREETAAPVVQRYQAGDSGHGGIEHRALPLAGFTADEASQVYFGNWLRDFSQLSGAGFKNDLIDILALGEFGREIRPGDLGTYVPSEHLDNPEGGGTIEDPRLTPQQRAQKYLELSPEQQGAFDRENRVDFHALAGQSHVPDYVERGKYHAKEQLAEAVSLGRNQQGMQHMGNGLHAVEDYFSHSNFVEVAAWDLQHEGVPLGPLEDQIRGTTLGDRAATVGGMETINGRPRPSIVTGTYGGHANTIVSLFETIKTEVEHGQLTKAFILGWLRKTGKTGEEIGERLGHGVGGAVGGVVGAVGGGVSGAVGGAAHGAAQGWEQHSGWSALGHAVTGFFSGGASGAVAGGRSGEREGERVGGDIGGSALGAVGGAIGTDVGLATEALGGVTVAALLVAFPEVAAVIAAVIAAAESDIVAKVGTLVSGGEARQAGLSGPTHSEIAKDAPDNPLFAVSARLAEVVDQAIGCAMIAAWNAHAAGQPLEVSSEHVTSLVDKYVQHPAMDPWWRDYLISATHGALRAVPSTCDASQHDDGGTKPPISPHPTLHDTKRAWERVIEPFATGKATMPSSGAGVVQALKDSVYDWRRRALAHDATALRAAGIDPEKNFHLSIDVRGWASKVWRGARNEHDRQKQNEALSLARAETVADALRDTFRGVATVDDVEGLGSAVLLPQSDTVVTEEASSLGLVGLELKRAALDRQLARAQADHAPADEIARLQHELRATTRQITYFHKANDPRANVEETRRVDVSITWEGQAVADDVRDKEPASTGK